MNEEQLKVIEDIYSTLGSVANDKATEYEHHFKEGHNEWTETVDREQHLQAIIEWVIQQIENNFEWENEWNDEKAKEYREERDIKGAEAIEQIVLDDLEFEFESVYGQFEEEFNNWEQKYKRFENVCTYYGVPVPTLKDNNVIQFRKGVK